MFISTLTQTTSQEKPSINSILTEHCKQCKKGHLTQDRTKTGSGQKTGNNI